MIRVSINGSQVQVAEGKAVAPAVLNQRMATGQLPTDAILDRKSAIDPASFLPGRETRH